MAPVNVDSTTAGADVVLVTGSRDGTVRSWNASAGTSLMVVGTHIDAVTAVSFCPTGPFVASASADSTAKIWNYTSGQNWLTFSDHKGEVLSVSYSADGKRLLTSGADGLAMVWDVGDSPAFVGLLQHSDCAVSSTAFAPVKHKGDMMVTGCHDRLVRVWSPLGVNLKVLSGHEDEVTSVAWSPDGTLIASAAEDGSAKVWSSSSGTCLLDLLGHRDAVTSVAFAPDSAKLVTGGADGVALVWSAAGHELLALRGHKGEVTSVAFSPDGQLVATGSVDCTIKTWCARTGRCLATLEGHQGPITCIAFKPDPLGDATSLTTDTKEEAMKCSLAEQAVKDYARDPTKWLAEL